MVKLLSIVGCKNAGKTRTCELLIPALRKLGLSVGTLKFTEHEGFDWDVSGKDTFRHRQAGSEITGIFGRHVCAVSDNRPDAPGIGPFDLIRTFYAQLDLVLIEGYRCEGTFKLEVMRPGYSHCRVAEAPYLLATYGAPIFVRDVIHFNYGDESGLAQFVADKLTALTTPDHPFSQHV